MLYSVPIPEGWFDMHGIFRITGSFLRVRGQWLADQLSRPEFNGIAGPVAANLAVLNRMDVNEVADAIIRNAIARGILRPRPHALTLTELTVPDDEVCVICLRTKAESQNETWVTRSGVCIPPIPHGMHPTLDCRDMPHLPRAAELNETTQHQKCVYK